MTAKYKLTSLKRGTGGRCSFNGLVATVFGGTGFLGRYLCNELGKIGTQMILPFRGDFYDVRRLRLMGDLGQVLFQPFQLKDDRSLEKAIKYSNVVINLIGEDWETRNYSFDCVHVERARKIAQLSKCSGVETFIHVSALNATENPESLMTKTGSLFLVSKARGEEAVREEFPEAIIIRPADIWGSEDRYINYYCNYLRRQFKAMPLYKSGECTEKQPVYVGDVARGIVAAIKERTARGKIFQAVGPKRYLLSEIIDWFYRLRDATFKEWGYFRYDIKKDPFFRLRVTIVQWYMKEILRGPVMLQYLGWDRLEREAYSDLVSEEIGTLEDLGICLTPMEDLVPWLLRPFNVTNYYEKGLHEFKPPSPPKFISV